jgi:hypothetical protein
MEANYIIVGNNLVIKKDNNFTIFFYLIPFMLPLVIIIFLYFFSIFNVGILLLILCCSYVFIFSFGHIPPKLKDITIQQNTDFLIINQQKIEYNQLLFLSIREKDDYKIIRLEAVRKNILIPNEFVLFNEISSLEEGIILCKKIKKFIHQDLKINVIKIGNGGASIANPNGIRNKNLEAWYFIKD